MKMNDKKILVLFISLMISQLCFCEYRVYQYSVKNKINTSKDQPNAKFLLSTLNPVSYLAYNGGSTLITVDLLRTWICPGHTGNRIDFCPSPYDKVLERLLE